MLKRLKTELLSKDASACLPRSLTDEWLSYLTASAEGMLEGPEMDSDSRENSHVGGAACLTVVIHLVQAKTGGGAPILQVSEDDLFEYVQIYRTELALEEVHRRTDVKYEPATLANILTNREVTTWHEPANNGPDEK